MGTKTTRLHSKDADFRLLADLVLENDATAGPCRPRPPGHVRIAAAPKLVARPFITGGFIFAATFSPSCPGGLPTDNDHRTRRIERGEDEFPAAGNDRCQTGDVDLMGDEHQWKI